jgi:hypothetical protein
LGWGRGGSVILALAWACSPVVAGYGLLAGTTFVLALYRFAAAGPPARRRPGE